MTPQQIELVQTSWRKAKPIAGTVARLFYRRLFQLAPELRTRIRTSMSEQEDSLLAAVEDLTLSLDAAIAPTAPPADALADHADSVAEAWTWTLSQELGREAPLEARKAWKAALSSQVATPLHAVALGELELAVA